MTSESDQMGRPKRASFLRSIKAVAWSFLGVRKNSDHQDDLDQVNPFHVIAAGFLGVMVLVIGLIGLVNWVVAG